MRRRTALPLGVLFLLTLTAADCEDPQVVPVPTSIELISGDGQQAEVGAQLPQPLVVRVLDQNDDPMPAIDVTWAASAGTIVGSGASDESGETSATWTLGTEVGTLDATASLNASTSVDFTATAVAGALAAITLTPDSLAFDALGDTATITASGQDAHGNEVGFTATWTSRDSSVATVDAAGTAEAAGNGATWLVASSNGVSDSARVVVEQGVAAVEVTPAADTIGVADSATFTAEASDANGHTVAVAFTWGTVDTAIATVDSAGVVTGVAEGTTQVFASAAGVADSADVTVETASGVDADIVGEWTEVAVRYVNKANTNEVVDTVDHDYVGVVNLRADASFTITEQGDGDAASFSGEWSVTGDTLTLTVFAIDSTFYLLYELNTDGQLVITYDDEKDWDFTGDGVNDSTITSAFQERTVDLPALVGTWSTTSVVAVNVNDTTQTADLTADVAVTGTFKDDRTFSMVIVEEGITESETGWYVTTENLLWLAEVDGGVDRFDLALTNDTTLVLTLPDSIDIDGDGSDEAVRLHLTFGPGTAGGVSGSVDPNLVGDWLGISYVLENQNDTSQSIDVVAEENWLMELSLESDGTWSYQETYADGTIGWSDAGSWYTRSDSIVIWSNAEQDSVVVPYDTIDSVRFTYQSSGEEGWDFDGDGVDEPTNETAVMRQRQDHELVGTWVPQFWEIENANDSTETVDVLAEGGTLTATFYSDGSFIVEESEPDLDDYWDLDGQTSTESGGYAAAEPYLWTIDFFGVEYVFINIDGDTATVVDEYTTDGTGTAVIETIVVTRQ